MKQSENKNTKSKTKKLPWYAEGLRFSCLRCGDCCRGEPGFVWVTPDDVKDIAEHLGIPLRDFKAGYVRRAYGRLSLIELDNGDCIFWSAKGCKVYTVRPTQCGTFPFWPEHLRSTHAWGAVQKRCPAIDTGQLRSLEEIRARLRKHRNE